MMVSNGKSKRKRKFKRTDSDKKNIKKSRTDNDLLLLKLLIPSDAAGAVIGKGGENLKKLKKDNRCLVRISKNNEVYPGTDERVLVATGRDLMQLMETNNFIMEKIADPGREDVTIDKARKRIVKMVITDSAVGLIIGKGGETMKKIQTESEAKVHVAMPDQVLVKGERIVHIKGNLDQREKACRMIFEKMADDQGNRLNDRLSYETEVSNQFPAAVGLDLSNINLSALIGGITGNINEFGGATQSSRLDPQSLVGSLNSTTLGNHYDMLASNQLGLEDHYNIALINNSSVHENRYDSTVRDRFTEVSLHQGTSSGNDRSLQFGRSSDEAPQTDMEKRIFNARISVEIDIPNKYVGSIVGTKGSIIKDMVRQSGGANFRFADKTAESEDRTLTIKGKRKQIENAILLLRQRVTEIEEGS